MLLEVGAVLLYVFTKGSRWENGILWEQRFYIEAETSCLGEPPLFIVRWYIGSGYCYDSIQHVFFCLHDGFLLTSVRYIPPSSTT